MGKKVTGSTPAAKPAATKGNGGTKKPAAKGQDSINFNSGKKTTTTTTKTTVDNKTGKTVTTTTKVNPNGAKTTSKTVTNKNGTSKTTTTKTNAKGQVKSKATEKVNKKGTKTTSTTTFDPATGRKTNQKTTVTKKNGSTSTKETKYYKSGKKKSVEKSTSNKNKTTKKTTVYRNDKTNSKRSVKTTTADKKTGETTTSKTRYVQKDGKPVPKSKTVEVKDKDGKVIGQKEVKYKDGVKTKSVITTTENGATKKVVKKYDKGKITDKTVRKNGKIQTSTKYIYDEKTGKLSTKEIEDRVGGTKTTKNYKNYKTNKDGTTSRDVEISKTDNTTGKTTKFTAKQTLDKNGKLTRSKVSNESGKLIKDTKIDYDKDGNFKSKSTERFYSDGSSRTVTLSNRQSNGVSTTYDKQITFKDKDGKESQTVTYKVQLNPDGTTTRVKTSDNENIATKFIKGAAKLTQSFVNWFKGLTDVTDDEKAAVEAEFKKQNNVDIPEEQPTITDDPAAQDVQEDIAAAKINNWAQNLMTENGDKILDAAVLGNTVISNWADGSSRIDNFTDKGDFAYSETHNADGSVLLSDGIYGSNKEEALTNIEKIMKKAGITNIKVDGSKITGTDPAGKTISLIVADDGSAKNAETAAENPDAPAQSTETPAGAAETPAQPTEAPTGTAEAPAQATETSTQAQPTDPDDPDPDE